MTARRTPLDATRWHFSHGPIDLVIEAEGRADAVMSAHDAAWRRFEPLLGELVAELHGLRLPVTEACPLKGPVARRMWQACAPYRAGFITPMAAVAGAVAQEIVACYRRPGIERAWVNNGGDIALHLAAGRSARVGLFADLAAFDPAARKAIETDAHFDVEAHMPVRGIATSGWRGRSFSLGIADSVTVLAATAAEADAAATVIANAVDVDDAGIRRRPANECKDDSDLGTLPVTVQVDALAPAQVRRALASGAARAASLQARGLIVSAMLVCQGQWRFAEPLSSQPRREAHPAVGSVFA